LNSLRQYPLYSKTEPPAALKKDFEPGQFEKSQAYGKDKAKFAFVSGLWKQCTESALLHYGFYPWAWEFGSKVAAKFGYGEDYQVRVETFCASNVLNLMFSDSPIHHLRVHLVLWL
jgi:STE24 endopeptidase